MTAPLQSTIGDLPPPAALWCAIEDKLRHSPTPWAPNSTALPKPSTTIAVVGYPKHGMSTFVDAMVDCLVGAPNSTFASVPEARTALVAVHNLVNPHLKDDDLPWRMHVWHTPGIFPTTAAASADRMCSGLVLGRTKEGEPSLSATSVSTVHQGASCVVFCCDATELLQGADRGKYEEGIKSARAYFERQRVPMVLVLLRMDVLTLDGEAAVPPMRDAAHDQVATHLQTAEALRRASKATGMPSSLVFTTFMLHHLRVSRSPNAFDARERVVLSVVDACLTQVALLARMRPFVAKCGDGAGAYETLSADERAKHVCKMHWVDLTPEQRELYVRHKAYASLTDEQQRLCLRVTPLEKLNAEQLVAYLEGCFPAVASAVRDEHMDGACLCRMTSEDVVSVMDRHKVPIGQRDRLQRLMLPYRAVESKDGTRLSTVLCGGKRS